MIMQKMIRIIMIFTTVFAESPELNYTYLGTFRMPRISTVRSDIYMALDDSRMIMKNYTLSKPPVVYDLYSSQLINKTEAYYLHNTVNQIFFVDAFNTSRALYSNFMGQIIIRKYGEDESYEDLVIYTQICSGFEIGLAVSSDGYRWVRACYNSGHILVGFIEAGSKDEVMLIQVDHNITDVLWRPGSNQILMTTSKTYPPQNNSVIIMDLETNRSSVFFDSDRILKTSFVSPSGLLILFFSNHTICSYNFSSNKFTYYKVNSTVKGIKMRGQFIVLDVEYIESLIQRQWEYYYEFGVSTFTEENVFFKIEVVQATFGSIQEGTFLYAEVKNDVDGTNLTIYKLCNKQGWYYDSKKHQCQLCHEPCLDCLYRSNSCVSCHLGYYLIALNHNCLQCSSVIANCESCQSDSNCTQCMKGYALLGDSCQLCSDYLEGCSICQSVSKCSQCQQQYELDELSAQCRERSSFTWAIVLTIILATILILGAAILILRQRSKKQKQRDSISILLKEQTDSQVQD